MATNPKTRSDIKQEFTWDLSTLYASKRDWERDFNRIPEKMEALKELRGTLAESAANVNSCLQREDELFRLLEKLHVYAHLRSDEDKANTDNQALLDRITAIYHDCITQIAWMQPELMAISDKVMDGFLHNPELAFYKFALEQKLRYKPHTLTDNEEKLLAQAGEALSVAEKAFSMLNNVDIHFEEVEDDNLQKVEMTHALYSKLMESYNRDVRRGAFKAMYKTFGGVVNTMATLLDGAVKANVFKARARKFPSAIEASLFHDNVSSVVYDNLVEAINTKLPAFHKYIALRKRVLDVKDLDMYDMYVPLVGNFQQEISWEQARSWVIASLAPLGHEYQKVARLAFTDRWIDILECRGKRSGAYSSGCYDSFPYMLLNYNGTLNSVFTLAHELGHSMHTHLAKTHQEYRYAGYPIILAEIASTTNELLLLDYLLKETRDVKMKRYLLNYYCDGVKGTIFRQVQFAEFERDIYRKVEKMVPLTVAELNNSYAALNQKYYGPEVKADDDIKLEWTRIPHFYYNFYVYKYATGFSAANGFSTDILSGSMARRDSYLEVLKAGSSAEPLDILSRAGMDLTRPDPVHAGLDRFEEVVGELDKIL